MMFFSSPGFPGRDRLCGCSGSFPRHRRDSSPNSPTPANATPRVCGLGTFDDHPAQRNTARLACSVWAVAALACVRLMPIRPLHVSSKYRSGIDADGGTIAGGESTQSTQLRRLHTHE